MPPPSSRKWRSERYERYLSASTSPPNADDAIDVQSIVAKLRRNSRALVCLSAQYAERALRMICCTPSHPAHDVVSKLPRARCAQHTTRLPIAQRTHGACHRHNGSSPAQEPAPLALLHPPRRRAQEPPLTKQSEHPAGPACDRHARSPESQHGPRGRRARRRRCLCEEGARRSSCTTRSRARCIRRASYRDQKLDGKVVISRCLPIYITTDPILQIPRIADCQSPPDPSLRGQPLRPLPGLLRSRLSQDQHPHSHAVRTSHQRCIHFKKELCAFQQTRLYTEGE